MIDLPNIRHALAAVQRLRSKILSSNQRAVFHGSINKATGGNALLMLHESVSSKLKWFVNTGRLWRAKAEVCDCFKKVLFFRKRTMWTSTGFFGTPNN